MKKPPARRARPASASTPPTSSSPARGRARARRPAGRGGGRATSEMVKLQFYFPLSQVARLDAALARLNDGDRWPPVTRSEVVRDALTQFLDALARGEQAAWIAKLRRTDANGVPPPGRAPAAPGADLATDPSTDPTTPTNPENA